MFIIIITPIYRWGYWGFERLSKLLKYIQGVGCRFRIWTQASLTLYSCSFGYDCLSPWIQIKMMLPRRDLAPNNNRKTGVLTRNWDHPLQWCVAQLAILYLSNATVSKVFHWINSGNSKQIGFLFVWFFTSLLQLFICIIFTELWGIHRNSENDAALSLKEERTENMQRANL